MSTLKNDKKRGHEDTTMNENQDHNSASVDQNRVTLGKPNKKSKANDKVKNPVTAYLFYLYETREILMEKYPDIAGKEIKKMIDLKWQKLSKQDKEPYILKATHDKARYKKELIERKSQEQSVEESKKPATHVLKPIAPNRPICIAKNMINNKYIFPKFTKDDTLNARMFLKYYGSRKFLDTYLPSELNSLYLYFLIRLLGFELKDHGLTKSIQNSIQNEDENVESSLSYTTIDDPLAKKQTIRLIRDLQRAINKVLATRLRLFNFAKMDDFVKKLKSAKNIILLTGAGVSTSLGIPDFRSSQGFYSKIKYLGLSDPQDVFNYELFRKEPSIFYSIANMILPPENTYSPLHGFIKMLCDKGKLLRNYTQNIDNLESYAGIPEDKIVHCHGSFATATCVTCHWKIHGSKIFTNIRNVELPICPNCYKERSKLTGAHGYNFGAEEVPNVRSYGVLKPDITFFGEPLPNRFFRLIREDIPKCDLLICIGTSLKVAPVSEIVNMIPADTPQVLINRDPVKHAEFDLSLLGYCDEIAGLVTKRCGWAIPHKDWDNLADSTYKIDQKERGVFSVTKNPETNNK